MLQVKGILNNNHAVLELLRMAFSHSYVPKTKSYIQFLLVSYSQPISVHPWHMCNAICHMQLYKEDSSSLQSFHCKFCIKLLNTIDVILLTLLNHFLFLTVLLESIGQSTIHSCTECMNMHNSNFVYGSYSNFGYSKHCEVYYSYYFIFQPIPEKLAPAVVLTFQASLDQGTCTYVYALKLKYHLLLSTCKDMKCYVAHSTVMF